MKLYIDNDANNDDTTNNILGRSFELVPVLVQPELNINKEVLPNNASVYAELFKKSHR